MDPDDIKKRKPYEPLPFADHGPVAVQAESLYCFSATIRHKKGHLAVGCFDQPALCAEARGTAKRWGGVAGVKRLSDCERWSAIGGAR